MSTDIATAGERQSGSLISAILAAAKDPGVDPEKVKTMAELAMTLQDRELKAEFQRDLNAAMMEMPVITKDGQIIIPANRDKGTPERKQGKFARYEDIDRVCRPILRRHNLAIRFDIGAKEGGGLAATPILSHANGYEHRGQAIPAPIDTSGAKNNLQGVGSTITYLKRYAYCAALNIVTEGIDDDGNLGRGTFVTLPFEREELVRNEAKAAANAGRYVEWFGSQSPKDRAWLINSGLHEQYGGQPALPPAAARPAETTVEAQAKTAPKADPPPPPKEKPRLSARQWVDQFKADLGRCGTIDAVDEFMEEARESLDKLRGSNEAMWNESQQAYRDRRAALEEGRLV